MSQICKTHAFASFLRRLEIEGTAWNVFEGQRWIAPVKSGPQQLCDLEGWGAALYLRTGPYNSCQPEVPILNGLTNQGIVESLDHSLNTPIRVRLCQSVIPDASHILAVIGQQGQCVWITATGCSVDQSDSRSWILPEKAVEQIGGPPGMLAIAYDGAWLGSWWTEDWWSALVSRTAVSENSDDWAAESCISFVGSMSPCSHRRRCRESGRLRRHTLDPFLVPG